MALHDADPDGQRLKASSTIPSWGWPRRHQDEKAARTLSRRRPGEEGGAASPTTSCSCLRTTAEANLGEPGTATDRRSHGLASKTWHRRFCGACGAGVATGRWRAARGRRRRRRQGASRRLVGLASRWRRRTGVDELRLRRVDGRAASSPSATGREAVLATTTRARTVSFGQDALPRPYDRPRSHEGGEGGKEDEPTDARVHGPTRTG